MISGCRRLQYEETDGVRGCVTAARRWSVAGGGTRLEALSISKSTRQTPTHRSAAKGGANHPPRSPDPDSLIGYAKLLELAQLETPGLGSARVGRPNPNQRKIA